MLTITGYTLSQFQRCKRPYAISQTHKFIKWRPQTLLEACLRHGIFQLSNGESLDKVTSRSVNNFLSEAKNPGLDAEGKDTYSLAMDYCAIIRNVFEFLSRLTLLSLREVPPVQLSANVQWQPLSFMDETGTLHKWKIVDYISEDVLGELHGWDVFGDIAACDTPMSLHFLAIGKRIGNHQHSPWCKIYTHPKIPKVYRFQKRDTSKLEGEWGAMWFSTNPDNSSNEWVNLMARDNVFGGIIKHVNVKEVGGDTREAFKHDVLIEAEAMEQVGAESNIRAIPMSRYACDRPYICPHQLYCYSPSNITLDSVGIYRKKG